MAGHGVEGERNLAVRRQVQLCRCAADDRREVGARQVEVEDVLGTEVFAPAQTREQPGLSVLSRRRGSRRDRLGADADGEGGARRKRDLERQLAAEQLDPAARADGAGKEVDRRAADELCHLHVRGPGVELGWGSELDDVAAVHHGDPVRHGHRLDLVVGDVDEGCAEALVQLGELGAHVDAQLRVEVRQRLVHEEDVRMPDHGAAEGDALALAAGELSRPAIEQRAELELLRHRFDLALDTAHYRPAPPRQQPYQGQALMQAQTRHDERQAEIGPHRHVRVERVALEHHRDPPLVRTQMVDRRSADQNRAGILALDAGDDADQGCLPAAGRADEGHELAVRDGKVDAAEHWRRAERLYDRLKLDGRHGSRLPPRSQAASRGG